MQRDEHVRQRSSLMDSERTTDSTRNDFAIFQFNLNHFIGQLHEEPASAGTRSSRPNMQVLSDSPFASRCTAPCMNESQFEVIMTNANRTAGPLIPGSAAA